MVKLFLSNNRGQDIAKHRDERLAQGKSPNTVKNELILLSHLFNTAKNEWGMESLQNPVANVRKSKLPQGRGRRLFEGEEEKLLIHAEQAMDHLILLAIETAMRQGKLLSIRWENIDIKKQIEMLPDTKDGTKRIVPLPSTATKTFKQILRQISGKISYDLYSSLVSQQFGSVCKSFEIGGLRFHVLRREETSRLIEKGIGIMEVAAITGHNTLNMLKRYTHLKCGRFC